MLLQQGVKGLTEVDVFMNIGSLAKIGRSLGISKQAVAKDHVKYLVKNDNGKIDIDNPINKRYLDSKGADMSFFGVKPRKSKQKQPKTESKPLKTEHNNPESETLPPEENSKDVLLRLTISKERENIKSKRAKTELDMLKLKEANGKVIDRDIAEQLINGTVGEVVHSFITLPSSIVERIMSICEENPENKREKIIEIMQNRYTKEAKRIVEMAKIKYAREIKEQMKRAEDAKAD